MSSVVIDASVAIKWFVAEPGFEAARGLLKGGVLLCAPDLIVAETCNVGWKKARAGDMAAEDVQAIAMNLRRSFDELVSSERLAARAVEIAFELDHPVYDTFYLALAELRAAPLVTVDQRLVSRAAGTRWAALVRPLA